MTQLCTEKKCNLPHTMYWLYLKQQYFFAKSMAINMCHCNWSIGKKSETYT